MAARRAGLMPAGVPQTARVAAALAAAPTLPTPAAAPADVAAEMSAALPAAVAEPAGHPTAPAPEPVAAPPAVVEPAAAATPEAARRSRVVTLPAVDRSELPYNRGFAMYPSRHKQLLAMAFFEARRPWQIIDDALTAYVKQHYGDEPDSGGAA